MQNDRPEMGATDLGVLRLLYHRFEGSLDWPSFEELDYEIDRAGLGDAWDLLRAMPGGFIGGSDFRTLPSPTQAFHLTIDGMAAMSEHSDAAATDFRVFCASVVVANRLSDETKPPDAATVVGSELPRLVDMPATGRGHVIARVGKQWQVNGHLWTQFHGQGDSWSATLDRKSLRRYRGVTDTGTFLAAERQRWVQMVEDQLTQPRAPAGRMPNGLVGMLGSDVPQVEVWGGVESDGQGDAGTGAVRVNDAGVPAWFELLPADLAAHVRSRVAAGHLEDAFLHGWKLVAATLSASSGIAGDGTDLVNRAARAYDTSGMSSTDANAALGHFDLMRALARVRNVQAHSDGAAFTDLEAATYLLSLGKAMAWCTADRPGPT